MPAPALRHVRDFTSLIRYLEDELGWPLDGYEMDDLTFDYEPSDLGLKDAEAAKVKSIRQLRPLSSQQPWGIFFIEFDKKKLPVVVLRRILSHLVIKKRASANKADRAAWNARDLLFVSAFGPEETDGREIGFAHFHEESGDLPSLRVLGWDGADTVLKLQTVAATLKERLHWPEKGETVDAWRERWAAAFRHRIGHVIRTSDLLAEAMAALARRIRDAAATIMQHETERGPLRRLHRAFQTNLIHDLTEGGFADTYAQTITYGLFTAALSKTDMSGGRHGTALIASNIIDMVPVTNPFLKEMLATFLNIGGRKGGIDFDELGIQDVVELLRGGETDLPAIRDDFGNKTRGEDPVIHFYEHFLSAYNKQLKIQRGVFYTPQPVVSYIVRSVHELLQTEFGLADGLADTTAWGEMLEKNPELKLPPLTDEPGETRTISPDEPFVQILDPATGTATFLVEVIDVIHRHLETKWKKGGAAAMPRHSSFIPHPSSFAAFWNDYVPKALLPRLHAYELMMAPYAIAHMKIGLKLSETGYRFATEERARIYLTNALEPWVKQLPLIGFDALAHEAAAVNEIKRHKRFTVVIGNPPYAAASSNPSLNLDGSFTAIGRLIRPYFEVKGVPLGERNPRWLQDDYVKFIRYSQVEIEASGVGILGFITNHGYLTNPTFRGMRHSLASTFRQLHVADLHGNQKRREQTPTGAPDENVFDIQQGVAVTIAVRQPILSSAELGEVFHQDVWGSRGNKYTLLAGGSLSGSKEVRVEPRPEFWLFRPQDEVRVDEYEQYTKISDLFGVQGVGMTTARDDLVTDFDADSLLSRISSVQHFNGTDAEMCAKFDISQKLGWNIPRSRALLKSERDLRSLIVPVAYRPFDNRYLFYHDSLVWRTAKQLMSQMLGGANLALVSARSNKSSEMDHFYCTRFVMETKCGEATTQSALFPLYRFSSDQDLGFDAGRSSNLSTVIVSQWQKRISPGTKPQITPEDIFHYAYAVFHSPGYRSRYAEFLKIDFPRLPLTGNLELFRALARLGGELTALHLLESPILAQPITEFIQRGAGVPPASSPRGQDARTPLPDARAPLVEKVSWSHDTVWLDKAQTTGFHGVREPVWNFHIGGYQVCEKWLKDRKGRTLSADDIAHYHKIVIALSETIRLMAEIDEVIAQHGGWPGAFQTSPS